MKFEFVGQSEIKLLPGHVYHRTDKSGEEIIIIVGREEATLLRSEAVKKVSFESVENLNKMDWKDISDKATVSIVTK